MPTIRPETSADNEMVRKLVASVFGNADADGSNDESRLVDRLRGEGHARVSLVADDGGRIVGHIMLSEVAIKMQTGVMRALSLAPLAVLPDRQRMGIGSPTFTSLARPVSACSGTENCGSQYAV